MESERSEKLMQEIGSNVPGNWNLQIDDGTPSAPPAINMDSQTANQQRPIQRVEETQSTSTSTSETEERSTSPSSHEFGQEHRPHCAKSELNNNASTDSSVHVSKESAKEVADGEANPPLVLSMFDPAVRDSVRATFRTIVKATVGIFLVFPLMLCLFFGVGWSPKDNYKGVRIAVVDLDGGLIGTSIIAVATSPTIPFTVLVLSDVQSLDDIRHRIEVGDYNAALVASPGASAALLAAVGNSTARYVPAAAASFIFDEGRGSSMASILRNVVPALANTAANALVGQALAKQLAAAAAADVNPLALVSPVGVAEMNLHPVQFSGMNMATGLGFIMHWVMMLIATSAVLKICHPWTAAGVRKDHQYAAHAALASALGGILAFWPAALLRFLGASVAPGTYFAAWAFNWLGMIAFAGILLTLFRVFGPVKGAAVHSLFLLVNFICSPALAPPEIMYPPMLLGMALPFWNGVEGLRTILFGSYDVLGRNCGVFAGWIAIAAAVLAVQMRRERRLARERAAARAAAAARDCGEGDAQVVVVVDSEGPPVKTVSN